MQCFYALHLDFPIRVCYTESQIGTLRGVRLGRMKRERGVIPRQDRCCVDEASSARLRGH